MIERFLELRNAVSDILLRHKTAPPILTGMELSTSSKLLNILRPFEAATKEISGDTYCNSSKVIPLVHCMVSKLKALEIEEPLLNEVHKMALIEINKRMGAIEHVSLLAIATLLDPRRPSAGHKGFILWGTLDTGFAKNTLSLYQECSALGRLFRKSLLSEADVGHIIDRYKMNEYLLSSYLSNEIVGSISKRSGKAKNYSYADVSDDNFVPTNHKLIEDEGSSQYSTWLKRMNTFEDIQRQLFNKKSQHADKRKANRRQSININLEPSYVDADADEGLEYLEDGDVTGYAFTNNLAEYNAPINLYKNHQKSLVEGKAGNVEKQTINKAGYDNGYDDYNTPAHPVPNLVSAAPSKQTKEIGLKDITDIALTTLAFLSFGMFILQVLMCITMSKDDTSNMVMLPMEGTDNGDIPGDDNTEEIRRKRRSITYTQMQNIEVIDHLSKIALVSLNGVTSMSEDGGTCHHFSLCENNKFAKHLQDTRKLWIPVWR
ncbi:uncharacterized protein LOC124419252 [Lucilia cuprina]|uniref:uncharacterized protein LOC124419252 n=1 Tax=Lucilia cuprina TaxID=7375 RepID=UPI001F05B20D|nr:uncharacterized protein LOC124419252 [Lucilia cuprina]